MFVRAAQMLLDNELPWPPAVERLVLESAKRIEGIEPASQDSNVVHLIRPRGSP